MSNSREKFVSLAEKRTTRAMKDIKLIGNLSNRSNYSYTNDDAEKIVKALRKAVEDLKHKFDHNGEGSDVVFKL